MTTNAPTVVAVPSDTLEWLIEMAATMTTPNERDFKAQAALELVADLLDTVDPVDGWSRLNWVRPGE